MLARDRENGATAVSIISSLLDRRKNKKTSQACEIYTYLLGSGLELSRPLLEGSPQKFN